MIRIVLILVAVAVVNALAWGIGYYDDASSMGGRADWWPAARTAVSLAGKASWTILKPFWWIARFSPDWRLTVGLGVLLEAAVIEVALRLYGVGRNSPDQA